MGSYTTFEQNMLSSLTTRLTTPISYHSYGLLSCTALMCVEVTAIVPPRQQALLRTASSVGAAAFNELVAQRRSTMHLEYPAPLEECGPCAPSRRTPSAMGWLCWWCRIAM